MKTMHFPVMKSLILVGLLVVSGSALAQSKSVDSVNGNGLTFGTGVSSPTTERMRITQGGNIGVGKTSAATALEVSGTVSASAVYGSGVLVSMPVGVILPWHKTMTGVPSLPGEWVECNGQTLSDAASPLNGQTLPDLNGQVYAGSRGYYLRGGNSSGAFNESSYITGNGAKYNFGTGSGSYYGVGYGVIGDSESGSGATYSGSDNTLGAMRFQVAAMTMVYIIKIK